MTRLQKLIDRFLSKPSDFTYSELKRLLSGFGYKETKAGKTSGSRVKFINDKTEHIISLHKPHRGKLLKYYQLNQVEKELEREGKL